MVVHHGSSPLVRGGPACGDGAGSPCRLIPARAGRTRPPARPATRPAAHPRSCGADGQRVGGQVVLLGSSPLVRGGLDDHLQLPGPARLIPARAGRTLEVAERMSRTPAHPRSCGADRSGGNRDDLEAGSSPLVRGGHVRVGAPVGGRRLIPARAGRTLRRSRGCMRAPAHPRSCGADRHAAVPQVVGHGSSPLVRGGPHPGGGWRQRRRLIPARAGRTHSGMSGSSPHEAHPRSCGADRPGMSPAVHGPGSSPLVRGGRQPLVRGAGVVRLIPARAGRTRSTRAASPARSAHPRSCGADLTWSASASPRRGSSPLVRGGLRSPAGHGPRVRLIPARAGRTGRIHQEIAASSAHPRSCGADHRMD